jgi:hypothetical protein
MRGTFLTVAAAVVLATGLACGGLDSAPAPADPAVATAKKPAKLNKAQAEAAGAVAAAKKKNGTTSPDGKKKLQVERKKKKTADGFVWVVVEEWVLVEDWHDEIWVVDAFVDGDDVLLVELDDFDDIAVFDEIDDIAAEDLDEMMIIADDIAAQEAEHEAAAEEDEELGGD